MDIYVIAGVILFGFLHGLEPGHGWPFAFLYSIKKENPIKRAFITSLIISISHLISSITVVIIYLLLSELIVIPVNLLRYITAGLLIFIAIIFWREEVSNDITNQHEHLHDNKAPLEHEHKHIHLNGKEHTHSHHHSKSPEKSLIGLSIFALILGFIHAEEFALIALFLSGANPWIITISYAMSVTAGLVGITLVCTKAYKYFLPRFEKYKDKIPKISAIILILIALGFIFNIL
ncbi:MAG: nickel/cobalt transporter [Promethearchaeota archaeon]